MTQRQKTTRKLPVIQQIVIVSYSSSRHCLLSFLNLNLKCNFIVFCILVQLLSTATSSRTNKDGGGLSNSPLLYTVYNGYDKVSTPNSYRDLHHTYLNSKSRQENQVNWLHLTTQHFFKRVSQGSKNSKKIISRNYCHSTVLQLNILRVVVVNLYLTRVILSGT